MELYERFSQTLKKNTSLMRLKKYLSLYPAIVYLYDTQDGIELRIKRDILVKQVKQEDNTFIMTAFERSLKHAGLYVFKIAPTNNGTKVWKIKEV